LKQNGWVGLILITVLSMLMGISSLQILTLPIESGGRPTAFAALFFLSQRHFRDRRDCDRHSVL